MTLAHSLRRPALSLCRRQPLRPICLTRLPATTTTTATTTLLQSHRPASTSSSSTQSSTMKTAPLDEVSATASPLFDAAIKDAAAATGTPSPSSSSTTLAGAKSRKPKQIPTFTTGDFPCSPQKLTHLARLIKHMSVPEAHTQMTMSKKRAADRVRALLHRVRCNLKENYNQDADEYVITQAWVGKGVFLKRLKIHGRARFGIMHRPRAHLKVVVERREVGSKEVDVEFERLVKIFRRKELFVPLRDNIPLRHVAVPWSAKPWKYVTSGKWVSPENARAKRQ